MICPLNSLVMHFTILNVFLSSPNWTFFLYKAVLTIGICLACDIPLGQTRYVFKSFKFIFSKDKDKGLF